ncbi:MAG: ABC transporter, partial [Kordiimonas sp.]
MSRKLLEWGGYAFEPFVEGTIGVSPGFVALLNSNQREYRFEFVEIPAQRRYRLLEEGKIDAIFFEMLQWG